MPEPNQLTTRHAYIRACNYEPENKRDRTILRAIESTDEVMLRWCDALDRALREWDACQCQDHWLAVDVAECDVVREFLLRARTKHPHERVAVTWRRPTRPVRQACAFRGCERESSLTIAWGPLSIRACVECSVTLMHHRHESVVYPMRAEATS